MREKMLIGYDSNGCILNTMQIFDTEILDSVITDSFTMFPELSYMIYDGISFNRQSFDRVIDITVDGIDRKDYPDFCDAYLASARWERADRLLSEDELEAYDADGSIAQELAYAQFTFGNE